MKQEFGPEDRPTSLLSQNGQLKKIGVWNWTIPALAVRIDGKNIRTCPSAGICAQLCYARTGAYRFASSVRKHTANLRFVLEDLVGWEEAMITEIKRRRCTWIRIHDAGDFFSDEYTLAWLRVIRALPNVIFYCYTKEVSLFRRLVIPNAPENFLWTFSYGGAEDKLLDSAADRVADVFPTEDAITQAGWSSQFGDDRLAVTAPAPVGMSANNIRHFLKRMDGRRFSEMQAELDADRSARKAQQHPAD